MFELVPDVVQIAREAVRIGQGDDLKIVEFFKDKAPARFRVPADLAADDARGFSALINSIGNNQCVLEGRETTKDTGVLALTNGSSATGNRCSGFLVSADILVTAAHCIVEGFLGSAWIHDDSGTRLGPALGRYRYYEPVGEPYEFANDIGIIRLAEPVRDAEILPIAASGALDREPRPDLRIVGYGKYSVAGAFSATPAKRTAPVALMRNRMGQTGPARGEFVIGDPTAKDGDACDGDSGGVIMAKVGSQDQLVGLVSRGINPLQTHCGDGTICVRLDEYTDWLDEAIQQLGGQSRPM